jgi:hypothetical protein
VSVGVGGGPHIKPRLFPVVSHQLLNGAHREWPVAAVLEQRRGRRGGPWCRLTVEAPSGVEGEQLADARLGNRVEGHHAAARAFADGRGEVEILPGNARPSGNASLSNAVQRIPARGQPKLGLLQGVSPASALAR